MKFNLLIVNIPVDRILAPTIEPNQSLQVKVCKGVSVKLIIKNIINIEIPYMKHPQNDWQAFEIVDR